MLTDDQLTDCVCSGRRRHHVNRWFSIRHNCEFSRVLWALCCWEGFGMLQSPALWAGADKLGGGRVAAAREGWRREGRSLPTSSYRAATTDLMSSEGTAISTDGPRPAPALPSKTFAHPGHPQGLSLTTRELWVRGRGGKCPSIPSWGRALPLCHLGNLCSLPPRRVWGNLGREAALCQDGRNLVGLGLRAAFTLSS